MKEYGRFVEEAEKIPFVFEGEKIFAWRGDSVSSALWRNGVQTITRSFKYHRRRGVLSLSGDDANVLVDIDSAPSVNGDLAAVVAGMEIRSRRHWGGLEKDVLSLMQKLSPFLAPGFYYRAFYQPRGAWRYWERLIRKLAGSHVVDTTAALSPTDKTNVHCDVAVIGGGNAGLAYAAAAAASGKRVVLLDKNPQLGGATNWLPSANDDEFSVLPDTVQVFTDCRATGIFEDNLILAVTSHSTVGGGGLMRLRAEKICIATGQRDTPCVFANNDLPGVMLTQAACRLAHLYDVAAGTTAVMLASSPTDAAAARTLRDYGINICAIFVMTDAECKWARELAEEGFNVFFEPPSAFAACGRQFVTGVIAIVGGKRLAFDCDCVLMNGGRLPKRELFAAAQNRPESPDAIMLSGGAEITVGESLAVGVLPPPPRAGGMCFMDFEEDLQPKDFDDAITDGFADGQLLKRYTTAGMGPAQGKLGNAAVLHYCNQPLQDDTLSTPRPPASAETLAQLGGRTWHPTRQTALHAEHRHLSARMMVAGAWLRPAIYCSVVAEATALRNGAGIIDVSTLGKIRLSGDKAAELLERMYTGKYAKQAVGTVRYALMLDESGVIADDGVVAKLDERTYWLTTTTGNSAVIHRNLLLWNARWELGVEVVNMTGAYGAVNVTGPCAETIMAEQFSDVGWADMGYMRCLQAELGGVPAIIMRIGFVGEKGYEVHLPYGYLLALWKRLSAVSTPCVVTPCGVETQRLLRLEKGHIIIGQDTDGLTIPSEVGMQWAIGKDKPFFIGQHALALRAKQSLKRRLVAFQMEDGWRDNVGESDLIVDGSEIVGRVTSVAYSPNLSAVIGLAFAPPSAVVGSELSICTAGGAVLRAQVVTPPFYDAAGERQK